MSDEIKHGLGATKERREKSRVERRAIGTDRGGIPDTFVHEDKEHCALDILLNRGIIEQNQYDAGYQLRRLYYTFTQTGRWIEEGGKAYEGDEETAADRARSRYNDALRHVQNSMLIRNICVEMQEYLPYDYLLVIEIQHGLDDLEKFFTKSRKKV